MASSPSASEGEILEAQMDKASTAQSINENMRVDRPSRKSTSSASTPDSLERFDRSRNRTRSRSRSPYRQRSPHGIKRPREDDGRDRQDSRQHKRHYEDNRRHKSTTVEGDRHGHRASRTDFRRGRDDRLDRGRDRKGRSRSRSPYRANAVEKPRHSPGSESNSLSKQQTNGSTSGTNFKDAQNAQNRAKSNSYAVPSRANNAAGRKYNKVHFEVPENQHEAATLPTAVVDEATQIEERRKRREALKAKLGSQPNPLLAQALNSSTNSGPSTPKLDVLDSPRSGKQSSKVSTLIFHLTTVSGSPSIMSPQSQNPADSPNPFSGGDDEALPNHPVEQADDGDEPSAADYNPTMDMEDDRAKHDHRFQHNISAGDYQETREQHAILTTNQKVEPMPPTKKDEFDMFADDDEDDDMFALGPSKPNTAATTKPKELAANLLDNWDDPDGYYRIILGELIDGRYEVQSNLGKGMFSGVVRALDNKTGKLVAIKLIRSNEIMKRAGLKEIDILQKLATADPEDKKHMIRLERSFEHKGHLCMVFENLSINLREVLKKFGRDVGINLKAVRSYAQQMFLGLSLMKKCNILHADLKPDNVLVNDTRTLLKICDLGSAGDASDNEITPYLVSRFYRAPEIMLGMQYDFGIDIWSIGCTLFELYTGKILFTGRSNNQMLKSIMECRGKFSLKMLKKAEFAGLHFDDNLLFRSLEKDKVTNKEVIRMLNFLRPTRDLKTRLMAAAKGLGETDMKEVNLFADLLDRCLALNPEKRITPNEALKHPFVQRTKA